MKIKNLANYIDHTILKAITTRQQIKTLCYEAIEYGFVAVCVPPCYLSRAKDYLKDTEIKVATVVGFPMGYSNSISKAEEALVAILEGADEIDMVANLSAIKEQAWEYVHKDIYRINLHCKNKKVKLKVIIEAALLTDEEIIKVCEICAACNVDFVKTSTGFHGTGAKLENVVLMRQHLPNHIKIKASGGIRTRSFALQLIEAGADRLGCSSGVAIMKEKAQ
ncbi:MAG: deoxyribose-phosphate aldolase [Chitinophagales bacterium]